MNPYVFFKIAEVEQEKQAYVPLPRVSGPTATELIGGLAAMGLGVGLTVGTIGAGVGGGIVLADKYKKRQEQKKKAAIGSIEWVAESEQAKEADWRFFLGGSRARRGAAAIRKQKKQTARAQRTADRASSRQAQQASRQANRRAKAMQRPTGSVTKVRGSDASGAFLGRGRGNRTQAAGPSRARQALNRVRGGVSRARQGVSNRVRQAGSFMSGSQYQNVLRQQARA